MVFSSAAFLFAFLPFILVFVYPLPRSAQNYGLLFMSVLFYLWGAGSYIWVIATVSLLSWLLAWLMAETEGRARQIRLWIGIVLTAAPLLFYKYAPVISAAFTGAFEGTLFLPLGISFFTFHAISYLVDVYRGSIQPARNLGHYLLYLFLFPHQIAGPIVRFAEIATEIAGRSRPSSNDVIYGLSRFSWGLAKKTVVADNAGAFADAAWRNVELLNSNTAWLAVLAYAIQIYFDFSAYSDMAIGIARVFNFHFPENFASPYTAKSATEFWRRWHMTLSRWFRDYVYIPFGGNRHGRGREYAGLLLTFCLTSLWHGAFWHFLVWGGLWSGLLLIERITGLREVTGWSWLRRPFMLFFILFSWVPFRSTTMGETVSIWQAMVAGGFGPMNPVAQTALTPVVIMAMTVGVCAFLVPARVKTRVYDKLTLTAENELRVPVALIVGFIALLFGAAFSLYASFSPFLYYQF